MDNLPAQACLTCDAFSRHRDRDKGLSPHTRNRSRLCPIARATLGAYGLPVGKWLVSGLLRSPVGLGMSEVHFIATDKKWLTYGI